MKLVIGLDSRLFHPHGWAYFFLSTVTKHTTRDIGACKGPAKAPADSRTANGWTAWQKDGRAGTAADTQARLRERCKCGGRALQGGRGRASGRVLQTYPADTAKWSVHVRGQARHGGREDGRAGACCRHDILQTRLRGRCECGGRALRGGGGAGGCYRETGRVA